MSSNVFQWTTTVKTWTNDLFILILRLIIHDISKRLMKLQRILLQ